MTEDALLEKIGKLIDPLRQQVYEQGANIVRLVQGQERIVKEQQEQGKDIKEVKGGVQNLELKVAIIHEDNKKEHAQLLNLLYDSNEINYKILKEELKKLEDRITHLEKHLPASGN